MQRSALFDQLLATDLYDLAIIGGGATGLGVALDAATRGYKVVLLESYDFAKGTSSRATKLVHGGVRYLAQGNLSLVREALYERAVLLHNAPHIAQPLAFVMPSYKWWETTFYGVGLMLYDQMAGKSAIGSTQFLSKQQVLDRLPQVQSPRDTMLKHLGFYGGRRPPSYKKGDLCFCGMPSFSLPRRRTTFGGKV